MQDNMAFHPPRRVLQVFQGLAILGGVIVVLALFLTPQRAWVNVLLVSNYLVGLALGALVLLALHYVTGARWSVPLRRLLEALTALLPVAGLGLAAVLLFQPSLYSWSVGSHSASAGEHASPLRSFWLERPFFLLRALAYLVIWSAFAWAIVRNSHRQDQTGEPSLTGSNIRLSAGFLVVFGVTCWLASNDWLMSLEPAWSSTVFGVYNFAGLFLSALATVTLLALWLRRLGPLRDFLTTDHLHDLGTLLFAFSCFWMYIWFCQYLLIWYTNHPEEAIYFRRRWEGPWPVFLLIALTLNWGIPFLVLLIREAKCRPGILAVVSLLILAGRWVDLYLMIAPSQGQGETLAIPGFVEAGVTLGAAGMAGLAVFWALGKAPLVPVNDPFFVRESLHQDQGDSATANAGPRATPASNRI
jgi:hypothetical protein